MLNFNHHIKMIEYKDYYTDEIFEEMVALFDERDLSEKKVIRIINTCPEHPKVVMMPKTTYENVFRSLMNHN